MAGWAPLYFGGDAARIVAFIQQMSQRWIDRYLSDASLASGCCGQIVATATLAEGSQASHPRLIDRLNRVVETQLATSIHASLFGGVLGSGWCSSYLRARAWPVDEGGYGGLCDSLDASLLALLAQPSWSADYDLSDGLVGIGVYALQRHPESTQSAEQILSFVVAHIESNARRDDYGVTWWTPADPAAGKARRGGLARIDHVDLGIAHGVAGVVLLLSAIVRNESYANPRARSLLVDATRWLLTRARFGDEQSVFPARLTNTLEQRPARTAWCYGDLAVSAALWSAGGALGDPGMQTIAVDTAARAGVREPTVGRVTGLGLCHGAAGVGHLLNRLYQASGDCRLRRAAVRWLSHSVDLFDQISEDYSLLDGASGIALALHAGATSQAPDWDSVLLLS